MKLGKLIKGLGLLLSKPYLLNEVLNNEERFKEKVQQRYGIEVGLPEIELDNFSEDGIIPEVKPYSFLDGGSLPTDLALLKMLCAHAKDCSYFEIGTWRGESVANVSSEAKVCFTLNQPEEEILRLQNGNLLAKQIGYFSRGLENVKHLTGNSFSFDFSPYQQQVDVIFIDGDHSYEGVKNDTEKCVSLLRDKNAVLVWHDYAHLPGTTRWEVLLGILDGLPKELHPYVYAVKNTKCAILSRKEYETSLPKAVTTPNRSFRVKIGKN